jgi:hypothetical protein
VIRKPPNSHEAELDNAAAPASINPTGRFLSADLILDPSDPQSWNGAAPVKGNLNSTDAGLAAGQWSSGFPSQELGSYKISVSVDRPEIIFGRVLLAAA